MEPSKLDHHQHLQREHLQGFSVAAAAPPAPTPLVGSNYAWKYSGLLLKGEPSTSNVSGVFRCSSPIDPKQDHEALLPPPPLGTSMVHDLGFHWPCSTDTCNFPGQLARTAAEDLPDSFLKLASFGAAVWNPGEHLSPSTGKYEQQVSQDIDVGLLCQTNRFQLPERGRHQEMLSPSSSSLGGGAAACEQLGSYTKMLLATSPSCSSFPASSFSMQELQALELLASGRFGQTSRPPSLGNVAFFGEGVACGTGHLPSPSPAPSNDLEKISSLLNGVKDGKRANGDPEYKASPPVPKKARAEPRSSTSPLKVRKEKLGDRVAALQQLVAPFGKTDTASVLTEAVGYIKFLQEQVQNLSMPYLRSSGKSKIRTTQGVPNEEKDETKQDLRSRGLCLVPLSYTSYFTSDTGSAWSPYLRGT